ncbi:helix-hairpin-helix domain-containing protein [Alteribacillus sp. HJP-4]|uniref:helix-hairpin-helix domain-containing protein n=1 Tax=Alteribacillus sp. HJP-4 TaxID=2775394 RepID=UPI0035CD11C9
MLNKKNVSIAAASAVILLSGLTYSFTQGGEEAEPINSFEILENPEENPADFNSSNNSVSENNEEIFVDVKGEVINPNVYEMRAGTRIIDAIDKAGGLTESADESTVNFSQKLQDEMVILVQEKGSQIDMAAEESPSSNVNEKIRINYADQTELESLTGIGPAKAEAIISYREENGMFSSEQELLNVSGIGEKSLETMLELITIN